MRTSAVRSLLAAGALVTATGLARDGSMALAGLFGSDPRSSFEKLVPSYLSSLKAVLKAKNESEDRPSWTAELSQDSVRYDVVKTASVVSPYEGVLSFHVKQTPTAEGKAKFLVPMGASYTVRFGFRDSKWEPLTFSHQGFFNGKPLGQEKTMLFDVNENWEVTKAYKNMKR
jgi:hypothetical protein